MTVDLPTRIPGSSGPVGSIEVSGQIVAAGGRDLYRINLASETELVAQVHPSGFDTLLSLLDDQGRTLIESEATSPANPDGSIDQPLPVGTYYLAVSSRSGTGAYDLIIGSAYQVQGNDGGSGPGAAPSAGAKLPTLVADFEANGIQFLTVANPDTGTITFSESQGGGTFVEDSTINLGGRPSALLAGDFNGDGRLDLGVADAQRGAVLILLGLGDGTFRDPVEYQVGSSPQSMAAGDFSGNGQLDIAVADAESNDVRILAGKGDGTFQPGPVLTVGAEPVAIVAADFNGDGRTDLVTANYTSGDLTFLYNQGAGIFLSATWQEGAMTPSALLATDLSGNGRTDLAIADQANDRVLVLWSLGGGTFSPAQSLSVGHAFDGLEGIDLDNRGDGSHDLIVTDSGSNDLTIFGGWEDGAYKTHYTIHKSQYGVVTADKNGGDGVFSPPPVTVPLPHSAPLVLAGGFVLSIDLRGQLLLRYPRQGSPGELESPTVVTDDGTGNRARELVTFTSNRGIGEATLDLHRPLLISAIPRTIVDYDVSYLALPAGGIYTRLAAGDFARNGRDDLAILDQVSNKVLILRQDASGQFQIDGTPIGVGLAPTDITVADLNQDGWLDLVVANGGSGDISVLMGGPGGGFAPEVRLRGGLSLAGSVQLPDGMARISPDEPVGVTTGIFDASGLIDVVVVNRGSNSISLLKGTLGGGLADPNPTTTYATGVHPTQAVAARLATGGRLDLAVLNEGSHNISIFMNDGHGGFVTSQRVDAGSHPTGFAVSDVNGDGTPDLVVGNDQGDVLILLGNGDGTFRPHVRANQSVNLAVGDLNGDGKPDFVVSNSSQDLLSVQSSGKAESFRQGRSNGLLAPGPVAIADMNGDGIPDLVVTNTGGNNVLVYLGLSGGGFAAAGRFSTGTAPVGLTIADLNGDRLPDLVVANEGSNDLSILLGAVDKTGWTLDPGPRLRVGQRPVSTTVADVNGDGIPDLFCVNQASNSVTLLTGLGGGFFNDRHPKTFAAGLAPIQAFYGHFSSKDQSGLVVLNSLSSTLSYYAQPLSTNPLPVTIGSGGLGPVAGAMGDFDKDGYAELIIANQADSRLALFKGSPAGLVLKNTVALDGSVRLSSLVLVAEKDGGSQLFVGAEGRSQAISLLLTTAGFASVAGVSASGTGSAVPVSSFGSVLHASSPLAFHQTSSAIDENESGVSDSASVQAGTQGGASAGPAASLAVVAQAVLPLFGAAFSSVGGLIEALMQMGQVQTSDILPLGGTDVALVAVIRSLARASDLSGEKGDRVVDGPGGELGLGLTELDSEVRESSDELARNRLLSNPEAALDAMPRGLGAATERRPGFGSEWVWRRPVGTALQVTMEVASEPALHAAGPGEEPVPEVSSSVGFASQSTAVGGAAPAEDFFSIAQPLILVNSALTTVTFAAAAFVLWKRRIKRNPGEPKRVAEWGARPHFSLLGSTVRKATINMGSAPLTWELRTQPPG